MKKLSTGKFNDGITRNWSRRMLNFAGLVCMAFFFTLSSCNTGNKQSDESGSGEQQEQQTEEINEERTAKATMEPASGSDVTGEVNFTQNEDGEVRIEVSVENLTPGKHAVHLHEHGDCSAEDASSAGGHWNPTMKPHGKRGEGTDFHKGDIDNMDVGQDGKGKLTMTIEGWSIGGPDSTNIVGKSVIIHQNADDFTSQPSGNAGGRVSCGVIKEG